MTVAPLVIACGALASELRAVLQGTGPRRRRRRHLPAGQPAQPAGADRAGAASRCSTRQRHRTARCSSATPTAAPAVRSTHCSTVIPRRHAFPVIALLRVLRRCRAVRGDARGGARHLLPHRLPGQALRRVAVAGARARSPSRSCATCTSATTRRVVLISQTDDDAIVAMGRAAAERLGLEFEHRHVGLRAVHRPRSRVACPCRSRGGSRDGQARSRRPRADRDLLARHPRTGQRAGRARPAPGRARRQVPASRRPRQAQGRDLHRRRGHRPVAPREPVHHRRPGDSKRKQRPTPSTANTAASDWACSRTTAAGKPTS